jgi:autotransporter translocation and assembly factor TamB
VKRWLRRAALGTAALLICVAGLALLIAFTPLGTALTTILLPRLLPESIEVGTVDGRLGANLTLDRARIDAGAAIVTVEDVALSGLPWPRRVDGGWRWEVRELQVASIDVLLLPSDSPVQRPPARIPPDRLPLPPWPALPMNLAVERITLQGGTVRRAEDAAAPGAATAPAASETLLVQHLTLDATALALGDDTIRLGNLVATADTTAELTAKLPPGRLTVRTEGAVSVDKSAGIDLTVAARADLQGGPDLSLRASAAGTAAMSTLSLTAAPPLNAALSLVLEDVSGPWHASGNLTLAGTRLTDVLAHGADLAGTGRIALAASAQGVTLEPDLTLTLPALAITDAPTRRESLQVQGEATLSDVALEVPVMRVSLLDTPSEPPVRTGQDVRPALEFSGRLVLGDPDRTVSGSIAARAIDPARFAGEAWRGRLQGQAAFRAALGDGTLQTLALEVEQLSLEGTLRDHPVSVTGGAQLGGGRLALESVRASSGQARLLANGTMQWRPGDTVDRDTPVDLSIDMDVPALGEVLPDARGTFAAELTLSGTIGRPSAEIDATARDIESTFATVRAIDVAATLDDDESLAVNAQARALQVNGLIIDEADLNASGTLADHGIRLSTRLGGTSTLETEVAGKLDQQVWRAQLQRLRLRHDDIAWSLAPSEPGATPGGTRTLTVSADVTRLTLTCLTDGSGHLCVRFEQTRTDTKATEASIELDRVKLSPITALLPHEDLSLSGELAGSASLHYAGAVPTAEIDLAVSAGELGGLLSVEGTAVPAAWDGATVHVRLEDDGMLDTRAAIDLGPQGRMDAHLTAAITDTVPLARTPLQGSLTATLTLPDILSELSREVTAIGGRAEVDLALAGNLAEPMLTGSLAGRELTATLPPLGIVLREGALDATLEADRVDLSARLDSGEGPLQLEGAFATSGGGWQGDITLDGERVLLADTAQARVLLSPALQASIDQRSRLVALTGTLTVAEAQLRPLSLSGAVTPSADERIIGAQAPDDGDGWRTQTQVTVVMGDAVAFRGYGLKTNIEGRLTIVDRPGEVPTGNGELSLVEGTYGAFGQTLTVERGRAVFVSSPLTNPGLDLIALRETNDGVTVRIEARGTLQDQQVSITTSPAVSQADALSYLLFGRPIDSLNNQQNASLSTTVQVAGADLLARQIGRRIGLDEFGVDKRGGVDEAQLVVGKYVSPQLYVRYGLGLFENLSTWLLRYDLSRRWSIEIETGAQNSADLLYTIDN